MEVTEVFPVTNDLAIGHLVKERVAKDCRNEENDHKEEEHVEERGY